MKAKRTLSVSLTMLIVALSSLVAATPANATTLERTFGPSGGYSIFDWTCSPRPSNTVWVEIVGYYAGGDNYVTEVKYKNFSVNSLIIHHAMVGANGQYTYFPARELFANSTVVYPVHRSFPGTMTVVNDRIQVKDFGTTYCGGTNGNLHAFARP